MAGKHVVCLVLSVTFAAAVDVELVFITCVGISGGKSSDVFTITVHSLERECAAAAHPTRLTQGKLRVSGCTFEDDEVTKVTITSRANQDDDGWCIEQVLVNGSLFYEHDRVFFWVDQDGDIDFTNSPFNYKVQVAQLTPRRQLPAVKSKVPIEVPMTLRRCTGWAEVDLKVVVHTWHGFKCNGVLALQGDVNIPCTYGEEHVDFVEVEATGGESVCLNVSEARLGPVRGLRSAAAPSGELTLGVGRSARLFPHDVATGAPVSTEPKPVIVEVVMKACPDSYDQRVSDTELMVTVVSWKGKVCSTVHRKVLFSNGKVYTVEVQCPFPANHTARVVLSPLSEGRLCVMTVKVGGILFVTGDSSIFVLDKDVEGGKSQRVREVREAILESTMQYLVAWTPRGSTSMELLKREEDGGGGWVGPRGAVALRHVPPAFGRAYVIRDQSTPRLREGVMEVWCSRAWGEWCEVFIAVAVRAGNAWLARALIAEGWERGACAPQYREPGMRYEAMESFRKAIPPGGSASVATTNTLQHFAVYVGIEREQCGQQDNSTRCTEYCVWRSGKCIRQWCANPLSAKLIPAGCRC